MSSSRPYYNYREDRDNVPPNTATKLPYPHRSTSSASSASNFDFNEGNPQLYSTLDHPNSAARGPFQRQTENSNNYPADHNVSYASSDSNLLKNSYPLQSLNPFKDDEDDQFVFSHQKNHQTPFETEYRGPNSLPTSNWPTDSQIDPSNDYSNNFDSFVNSVRGGDFLELEDGKPLPRAPTSFKENQLPSSLTDEEIKLKKNERNRIKNLRRLPKYHWTKWPYFTIIVTTIQIAVFIAELAKMSILTGSAFQTKPYFNPMLGPSTYLLINMGARYVPCMHVVDGITTDTTIQFPCPNSTTTDTNVCSLSELCGLSTIKLVDNEWLPNQWYRIFIPMFLHAGFLHIIFNLLLQVVMGTAVERHIGILKYAIIYIACGIAGFLLGANYTPAGIASTGASGALFGILAVNMIMFIYCGRKNSNIYGTKQYGWFIVIMIAEIIVSLVLGLLPGMDNFSHIGGFAMGIILAVLLLPDPWLVYEDGIITYQAKVSTIQQFKNNWNPMYNYQDKIRSRWIVWICCRVIALALAVVYFAVLAKNFFADGNDETTSCKWCKYINCLPVNGWCEQGDLTVSTTTNTGATSSSTPQAATTQQGVSEPTSIENGNLKEINIKRRDFELFHNSHTQTDHTVTIASNTLHHQQTIGAGFYLVMGFLIFAFIRRKTKTHS